MATSMQEMQERQEREHRVAEAEDEKSKRVWDPEVGTFLATAAVGSALTYGTIYVVGLSAAAMSALATAGWIVLAVVLGINAVGAVTVAVASLLHFK